MSRPDSDLLLNIRNLQLYKNKRLKYVNEISSIRYRIKNYDDKIKCKAKDRSCKIIRKYLITDLEKYNIQ